ncbi:MAG TPA: Nudix family hydrolase [Gammaproteobacteria bacterium]
MNTESPLPTIHVVAAVLHDGQGRVLIAERPAGKPLAGFWEFPGGKLEARESPRSALRRELQEELGVTVVDARPLIRFAHTYPERHVELDVWRVTRYTGEPQAREQQALAWVRPGALAGWNLLPADLPITQLLRLPPRMLVTPEPGADQRLFLAQLEHSLESGVELIQLRAPQLQPDRYLHLARQVIALSHKYGARVLLNSEPQLAEQLGADGVHLTSRRLLKLTRRPLATGFLVGASCHDAAELEQAEACDLDYTVLGPVLPTASHPDANGLGWERFAQLTGNAHLPVFAIGGLYSADLERARESGAYGVAAIRALWNGADAVT